MPHQRPTKLNQKKVGLSLYELKQKFAESDKARNDEVHRGQKALIERLVRERKEKEAKAQKAKKHSP
jgi:hypothetical protein